MCFFTVKDSNPLLFLDIMIVCVPLPIPLASHPSGMLSQFSFYSLQSPSSDSDMRCSPCQLDQPLPWILGVARINSLLQPSVVQPSTTVSSLSQYFGKKINCHSVKLLFKSQKSRVDQLFKLNSTLSRYLNE